MEPEKEWPDRKRSVETRKQQQTAKVFVQYAGVASAMNDMVKTVVNSTWAQRYRVLVRSSIWLTLIFAFIKEISY